MHDGPVNLPRVVVGFGSLCACRISAYITRINPHENFTCSQATSAFFLPSSYHILSTFVSPT